MYVAHLILEDANLSSCSTLIENGDHIAMSQILVNAINKYENLKN